MFCKRVGDPRLYEAFQLENGTITVSPQGGGFDVATFATRAEFDARFKEAEPDKTFRKGKVSAEFLPDDMELPCYSNGMRWNGWGMPWFDEETTKRVVEVFNKAAGPDMPLSLTWVDGVLNEYDWTEEKYYPVEVSDKIVDGKAIRLWRIGDGWTWNRVTHDTEAAGQAS
jgi:hypothetical protein